MDSPYASNKSQSLESQSYESQVLSFRALTLRPISESISLSLLMVLPRVVNKFPVIESRTLDVHIGLLHQKLNNQKLIETVRGVGYRII